MQRITRLRSAAGSDIAVGAVGEGRPLVYVSGWVGHLGLSWELRDERAFLEALGRGRRLLRYDRVGTGLSADRRQPGWPPSIESELDQLGAVIASLGPDPVDLVGSSMGAVVAVAWAAEHPETVRRLVAYGGWTRGSALSPPDVRGHLLGLVESHWGLGSDVLAEIFAPDADAVARRDFVRFQRGGSDAATARELLALCYRLDLGDQPGRVATPTLVVHRERDRAVPLSEARELASAIPGAELAVLPGASHLPSAGDAHELVTTIRRFLGLPVPRRGPLELTPRQREVAAFVSDGLTNREIGQRLGLQERSVEGHVERMRLRLGLRSRAQLAAWYAAHPTN